MRRQSGFTLLEVLVAFVLLATVGTALFQLYQGGLRNLRSSEEQTHAALLARSRLSELRAVYQLTPGLYEGNPDDPYRWRIELSHYEADAAPDLLSPVPRPASHTALYLAKIRIDWGEPDDAKYYQIRTLVRAREEQPS